MQISLIIGLGNPGKEYAETYHNVGSDFIAYIKTVKDIGIPSNRLLVPNTFMNEAGGFVSQALQKKKISLEKLLIVHDDSDIALGSFKYAFGRGSAGHKGIQSIITTLNTKNFWRLRIGIRGQDNRSKAKTFVLQKISSENKILLNQAFEKALAKMFDLLSQT